MLPRAPAALPDDFAAALGHAVAGFGFLEEALKHAIHALSREKLGPTPTEAELDGWVTRMEQIKGDSLGTLIDAFVAACARCGDRREFGRELRAVRDRRNMLCHASWKPTGDGGWRPGFVSSREIEVPARMEAADLRRIRAETLTITRRVLAVARATGRLGADAGDAAQLEAERARARARTAAAAAQRARRPAAPPEPEEAAAEAWGEVVPDRPRAAQGWHPLDQDKDAGASPGRRPDRQHPDPRRPRRDPEARR